MSNAEHQSNNAGNAIKTGWPIDFDKLRKAPPLWVSTIICTIGILLGLALFTLGLIAIGRLGVDLIGNNPDRASDAVKSILPLAAAAIGLPLIIWRLVILSQQTRTTEEKTQIDRETQYTSIFSRSVDQLGQSREVKETREKGDAIEIITRTVPNIEVRLGAIHSLNRLAEESIKDSKKIRDMLLSYVRENSWTDRSGGTAKRPYRQIADSSSWRSSFANGKFKEREEQHKKWVVLLEEASKMEGGWSSDLSDTRVDVSEAIDAVREIFSYRDFLDDNVYYEALFVGAHFKKETLATCSFERCSFVKCTFEATSLKDLVLKTCRLIHCTIRGRASRITIRNSFLTFCTFGSPADCTIRFRDSEIYDANIFHASSLKLVANDSSFYDCWITGIKGNETVLTFENVGFSNSRLRNLTLGSATRLNGVAFAYSKLDNTDLSQVENVVKSNLTEASANAGTLHPNSITRPTAWPTYDPENKLDDNFAGQQLG